MSRFRRQGGLLGSPLAAEPEDPMAAAANLIDLALVFIVGMVAITALMMRMPDLFNPDAKVAIIRNYDSQQMEIIIKDGRRVRALRATDEQAGGRAQKLGTAYRLSDGQVVYVPEAEPDATRP